jgi:hypothetical protein
MVSGESRIGALFRGS